MACCLTAPRHYLNQCWLIIRKVLWHSHKGNFKGNPRDFCPWHEFFFSNSKILYWQLLLPILQDNFWFTYIKYSIRFAEIHKQHSEQKQKLWMPLGIMVSTSSARDTQRLCPNNIVYTEHINCEYTTYSPYSRFRFKYHMCISVKGSKGSWKPRWVYGLLGWYAILQN